MHKPVRSEAGTPRSAPARPEGVQLRARRSPRLIALGVLLVVLGGLAAAAVYSATADQRAVVAMAHDVTRGSVLHADDLSVAEVPGGFAVDALPAERIEESSGSTRSRTCRRGRSRSRITSATTRCPRGRASSASSCPWAASPSPRCRREPAWP